MPGPGTHILVADRVVDRFTGATEWHYSSREYGANGRSPSELARIASAHANYYAFGAIGPDLFFFLPDFRNHLASPLIDVVHFLDDLYAKLDAWILEDWERYFGPGSENVSEAISRLTGDLSTVVADIMGSFSALLTNALLDLALNSHDWFGLFSLGLNVGYDNKDFFWSDMLHYRKTSQFAHNLWRLADERAAGGDEDAVLWSERLKAYALGYMTHVATDVTGHAFVNAKCGGPFRTHWQRHHLIENHIDARTHDDLHGSESLYNMFTESALHYRFAFADDGGDARARPSYDPSDNSLRGLYVRRRLLDLDSDLPEDLATLLFDAMDRTYDTAAQAGDHGLDRTSPDIIPGGDGRPAVLTIQETYHTFFRYMKMSTLDGFHHEKPMPPEVFPNLDFPQLTDPHDSAPGEGDDDMSFWDWILAILRFILWIAAVAIWLATILPAIVLDLLTYGPRLLAYYTIELPLFEMIKAERALLVMTGYLHPMQDEIDAGLIQLGNNDHGAFLTLLSSVDDILGTGLQVGGPIAEPIPDRRYPHQTEWADGEFLDFISRSSKEYHHPWDYPDTPVEPCPTFAGPFPAGALPDVLLDGATPPNEVLFGKYARAESPTDTDRISFTEVTPNNNLGDPVNFSSYLIWQLARDDVRRLTDFNMDADRGYGYKCWDWNRRPDDKDGANRLTDTEGHEYLRPCTPPPQSKAGDYDTTAPLKIHYLDGEDPGCDVNVECPGPRKPRDPHGPSTHGPVGRGGNR